MRAPLTALCIAALLAGCEGEFVLRRPPVGATVPPPALEAQWPAHLLTAAEYNQTLADLLGTRSRPADFFPATSATEFDANIGVLASLSQVQGEALFAAAKTVSDELFADPALSARILTCTPNDAEPEACARSTVAAFGRRAFRRTLDADELEGFLVAYRRARGELSLAHPEAIMHLVRIILSSPSFFLRIELDGRARATLASRLSYLLWASMPDDALLDAAEGGALADDAALLAQADRLLDAPGKGPRFVQRFLGQWLGTARLPSHRVDTALFPAWTPAVASAAQQQADAFLASFVTGSSPWSTLFEAQHPQAAALVPLLAKDPAGVRRGLPTLPGMLALSSHAERTSPTSRAKLIVTSLFCTDLTPPPGVSTELPAEPQGSAPQTVRARLEAHRQNPTCASCHNTLDPLGLSLEHFDPTGSYRTVDEGQPIDASGTWNGKPFRDSSQLLPLLSADPRLGSCPPRKLLGYALRRSLRAEDEPQLQSLASTWSAGTLRALLHDVIRSPQFRGAQ